MSRIMRRLVLLGVPALAACSSLLPQPAPPPPLYRLNPATQFTAPGPLVPVQLVVDPPLAQAALDTTRVALTRSPTTLDYFADAAWTDHLSAMVQALLVASLDNAHRLAAVGPQSGDLRADVALVTNLRHFEAVYSGKGAPKWHIEISAKLVAMPGRTLIAGRDFSTETPASANAMPAIIDAADAAWRRVAAEIADWTATSLVHRMH
jgi:cholesterol transport system auxiliary component